MKLSRLIGEEAQSPGLGLALELLVLVLVGVFVGLKADLLVGVASVLALDFLGIRRFLQRRKARVRFQRSSQGDPLADVDGADFMRGWWKDLVAAGFYGLAFSMVYPSALLYLEHGMLQFAIPRGKEVGYVEAGDVVVVTQGVNQESGSTSLIRVLTVDE